MLQCCLVSNAKVFLFLLLLKCFQLSILENKVIGGAVFEIRNKMEVPEYVQELLIFLSFPFLFPFFPLSLSSLL